MQLAQSGCTGHTRIDRHVLRTGSVRAQPDAIADCGSDGVADCCPYAVAHSEPNTGAYARPDAVANSGPHTEVRQCHNDRLWVVRELRCFRRLLRRGQR